MTTASDVASVPGWYGKLPTLGDFASRRLEGDFVEPWDLWLGDCMQAQREAMGDAWLDAYMTTPPWRFLLTPGVLHGFDPRCVLAGVLMPSVDRVGRHFPLTIAASLSGVPSSAAEFDAVLTWLHRLEDAALDALQSDWSIDDLEHALSGLAPPTHDAVADAESRLADVREAMSAAVRGGGGFVAIDPVASRAELASVFAGSMSETPSAAHSMWSTLHGIAFWISDLPGRPQLLVSQGLPGREEFARMFSGGGAQVGAARHEAAVVPPIFGDETMPLRGPADGPHLLPDDVDLVAMLAGAAPAPASDASVHGESQPGDILALFGALPDGDGPAEGVPNVDDVLPPFDGEVTDASPERREGSKEPDILDMFGAHSSAPGQDPLSR